MSISTEMDNTQLKQYIKDNVKKNKNGEQDYTYCEMLLYNDLTPDAKIGSGLDSVIEVYDKLHDFGLSLSGYQFIGLVLEKSYVEDSNSTVFLFAYFMLATGFIVSLFGSLLSFCMQEFLIYMKNESNEYIVKNVIKYRRYLKLPHNVLLVNTFLFALPINIVIHNSLTYVYSILFNVISIILLSIGFPIHRKMVANKQKHIKARIYKND